MHIKATWLWLVLLIAAAFLAGCGQAVAAPQTTYTPTQAATLAPATVVPTAPPAMTPAATAQKEEATATAAPTAAVQATPVTYVMPGEDYGYPSPFAFYSRGPGYLRMSYLFDTLVWKDEQGYIPWLAEKWSVADDGVTWSFTLRQGVKWHDGQSLTADDVVFTFTYFQDKFAKGMVKWGWPLDKVASAEATDDGRVVVVHMKEPTAGVMTDLFGSLPIIPKHIWENVDDPLKKTDAEAVIGSSLFKLESYSKEEGRYVYAANPDFFLGKPVLDRLIFVKVKDAALSLLAKEVDEASFSGKGITSVKQFQNNKDYIVSEGPSHWVLKLYFNTNKPPFDQLAVRQAVAYAVNRNEIVEKAEMNGAVVASLGVLSPGTFWCNPNLPTYDFNPDKAKEMLTAAGVQPFAATLVTTESYAREAELIKSQLAEVGIDITVKMADRTTVDNLLNEGDFELLISGHGGTSNPDMDNPSVDKAWTSEKYQALYEQSRQTVDETQRRELVWQMQAITAQELPVLALWHPLMWEVYHPGSVHPFYTPEGVDGGIPTANNKMMFLLPH